MIDLKEDLEHGQFFQTLQEYSWEPRTANRYMRFAEVAEKIQKANPEALPSLSMSQWLNLKDWPDRDLAAFAKGKEVRGITLNEVKGKTTRELKLALEDYKKTADAALDEAQQKIVNLQADKDALAAKNFTLESELKKRPKSAHFAQWAAEMRSESALQAAICDEALDVFSQHVSTLISSVKPAGKKGHDDWRAATGHVLSQLGGLAAKTQMLFQQLANDLPDEMTVLQPDFVLQDDELDEYQQRRDAAIGK